RNFAAARIRFGEYHGPPRQRSDISGNGEYAPRRRPVRRDFDSFSFPLRPLCLCGLAWKESHMDFSVADDPAHVLDFRKEVSAWLAENMRGAEHLRWSASWSTREDGQEYKFRRGLAEKLGGRGWLFPIYPKEY